MKQEMQEAQDYFIGLGWSMAEVVVATAWCLAEWDWENEE